MFKDWVFTAAPYLHKPERRFDPERDAIGARRIVAWLPLVTGLGIRLRSRPAVINVAAATLLWSLRLRSKAVPPCTILIVVPGRSPGRGVKAALVLRCRPRRRLRSEAAEVAIVLLAARCRVVAGIGPLEVLVRSLP